VLWVLAAPLGFIVKPLLHVIIEIVLGL